MREIWELQLRLSVRSRRGAENVYAHPRFRAAYDFLLLREEAGEQTDGLGRWWTDFQNTDKGQQEHMLGELGKGAPRPRKRRRRSRKPAAGPGDMGKSA